jgi:Raf kinase inhibitor-like YbhB/YbcL family protein
MRFISVPLALAILAATVAAPRAAETPTGQPQQPAPPAQSQQPQQPPQGARGGGRGGGRGGVAVMTLTSTAFPDGGSIPRKYTQAGDQTSPPLAWSNVPDGVTSFVLIVHDVDAAVAPGTDDTLHWMLWNLPAAARSMPEGVPQAEQLPDGTRQISATGPYYRGPGAAAAGPPHHYIFELFALDATIPVAPVGTQPAATRAAVVSAMAGHLRGKAALVGLFKR